MMMYHHTKFGYKRFSSSEDVSRQMLIQICNVLCDLDQSDPIYSLDNLAYDNLPSEVH